MPAPSLISRLWLGLMPRRQADFAPGPYRAYTTKNDAVVLGSDLILPQNRDHAAYRTHVALYEQSLETWHVAAELAAMAALERIVAARGDRPLQDAVVSLLIDHSGSMRGQRAMLAMALAEFLTEFFQRLGAAVEVLGYTTQSWRGGQSRIAWTRAGEPKNPGRLCDLLHIVYRAAGDIHPGVSAAIRNMLRNEMLKENIDGEAVLWAVERLRACPQTRKILIPICDGAPVDDSTLLANTPDYLSNHLLEVTAALAAAGDIEVLGVGIDHDLTRYHPRFVRVTAIGHYAERLLPFLEAAILA